MSPPNLKPLIDQIRALPDTGEKGFEGMLREAVASVIGRQLRLVKSGPQGGFDAATGPSSDLPEIVVEAKRYGSRTHLSVDGIKAKMIDAVQGHPNLDLFILGATKEIKSNDYDDLTECADLQGIGLEVVDWPESSHDIPSLALLVAMAPDSLLDRCMDKKAVRSCLNSIRRSGNYQDLSKKLCQRLTRPHLGYSAAKAAMFRWLQETFATSDAALSRLGSPLNLLATTVKSVQRTTLEAAIDTWWTEDTGSPLAVLGPEGHGKSWLTASWLLARVSPGAKEMPLPILVPAADVLEADVSGLIARLLADRLGGKLVGFWLRRLRLWLAQPRNAPCLLMLIDGLDENITFRDWERLVSGLRIPPWNGAVRIILTCRPDCWNDLHRLPGLDPPPFELTVPPYSEAELQEFLHRHGFSITDLASDLLGLIRVPRYSHLVAKHYDSLERCGDMTRERLVLEDWRDRVQRRGAKIRLNEREFEDYVATLGRELLSAIKQSEEGVQASTLKGPERTRAALVQELGAKSGHGAVELRTTISEIVDGIWMPPNERERHTFRLNGDLAPHALGLVLVNELRDLQDEEVAGRLAEFIEPIQGQELAVQILRNSVSIALVRDELSSQGRALLVRRMVASSHFGSSDFGALWRLAPLDPSLFIGLAEALWMEGEQRTRVDEIMIKVLANSAESSGEFMSELVSWAERVLAVAWEDPQHYGVHRRPSLGAMAAKMTEEATMRLQEWNSLTDSPRRMEPALSSSGLATARLQSMVLSIVSYLPREPFSPALGAWSVSRSVMASSQDFDQLAWLLRFNREDPEAADRAIVEEAERLGERGRSIGKNAANLLLRALASRSAMERMVGFSEGEC